MKAPNMATITESLERSLQNCSLNNHQRRSGDKEGEGRGRSSRSPDHNNNNNNHLQNDDATLELNSHVSLPYHWEQCLDLKTGEIYYINWRNGMKAKKNPGTAAESSADFYYSEDEEDDDSSYDSEESSSESSSKVNNYRSEKDKDDDDNSNSNNNNNNVLVVAGCKSCLMYFMVPKKVEDCPKCNGQLLHFDRSENGTP